METDPIPRETITEGSNNQTSAESVLFQCGKLVCPKCSQALMEYNGLLELSCPKCGYREPVGGFT